MDICIMGIGRRGCGMAAKYNAAPYPEVAVFFADTDPDDLLLWPEEGRIRLGSHIPYEEIRSKDLGFSYNAAMAERSLLEERIRGARLVLLMAGLGGGTGGGATKALAEICRDLGIPCIALVTRPLHIEGEKRINRARMGFRGVNEKADLTFSLHQDLFLSLAERSTAVRQLMDLADECMVEGLQGLVELALHPKSRETLPAFVGVSRSGIFGVGMGEEPSALEKALQNALETQPLNAYPLNKSRGLGLAIAASTSFRPAVLEETVHSLSERLSPFEAAAVSQAVDPDFAGRVRVCVYLSGSFGEPVVPQGLFFTPAPQG